MTPLLQDPTTNEHATLITLFVKAVDEEMTVNECIAFYSKTRNMERAQKYVPFTRVPTSTADPEVIKFMCALEVVRPYDHWFNR